MHGYPILGSCCGHKMYRGGLIRQHGRVLLPARGLTSLCANSWQGEIKWPVGDNPMAPTLRDFSDQGATATWRTECNSKRWWHYQGVRARKRALPLEGISSVQFSRSVVSDSLRPHESQHTRPLCPSPTPRVHSDSRPSSQWYHPAISSSVFPFSSCPQSLPASESFPMSQLFAWGG